MSAVSQDTPTSSVPRSRREGELTVALVGRPNSGKSSLYNALTGGSARVGNYPGITVDILEGKSELPSGERIVLADLPGLYSIDAAVDEKTDEGVARAFLLKLDHDHRRLVVVQVVDPTRLALSLRLTRELLRARLPVVLALTHEDVLKRQGHSVDVRALSDALGVHVVLLDARHASERTTKTLLVAVEDRAREADAAEAETHFDPDDLARRVVLDTANDKERARRRTTARMDAVLLHPVFGPFLFLGLMALLFSLVFLVADPAAEVMDRAVGLGRAGITAFVGKGLLASFLADGLLGGAGTVLAFMPQIVILTLVLEILEASGYLARGAFLVDRFLGLLGLSGKSFLPLLMGHACAVPAISATRVIRDPKERLTTILVLPLMTCSARLPTYGLVIATFFAARSAPFKALVFISLYFAGIAAALIASAILRKSVTKGKGLPLVLEMPSYRLPIGRVVLRKAFFAATRFLRDVGTTILVASAVLWLFVKVPLPGHADEPGPAIQSSVAASVGRAVEPITRPAGFDWRINVGLIASFGQRELMVGTMGVIFGVEDAEGDPAPLTERLRTANKPDGSPLYSTRTALALLAFFVLACQCMSTVAAIRRETKSFWLASFVVIYTYAAAYAAAVIVYQVSGLFGVR